MASQWSRWDMDPKNLLPLPQSGLCTSALLTPPSHPAFPGSPPYTQDNLVTVSSLAPQQPSCLSLPSKSRLPTQSVLLGKCVGKSTAGFRGRFSSRRGELFTGNRFCLHPLSCWLCCCMRTQSLVLWHLFAAMREFTSNIWRIEIREEKCQELENGIELLHQP